MARPPKLTPVTNPEVLPPVIVALDVRTPDRAKEIMTELHHFHRHDVGLQIRASLLIRHGQEVIKAARKNGWTVIAGTGFGGEPRKLELDLDTYIVDHKNPDVLPRGLTLEPPHESSAVDFDKLKDKLRIVHETGVATIGIARTDQFLAERDVNIIAERDFNMWQRAKELGITAAEVIFRGLHYGSQLSGTPYSPDGPGLIVSKISQSLDGKHTENPIPENSRIAYSLGANSVLLGQSIVDSPSPVEVVRQVLEAHTEIEAQRKSPTT